MLYPKMMELHKSWNLVPIVLKLEVPYKKLEALYQGGVCYIKVSGFVSKFDFVLNIVVLY